MARLTVFAKGNTDLVESLFVCRDATGVWNGINESLRARRPDWRVRLQHETLTRSDALLAATGAVPPALAHLSVPWPYELPSQFSTALFDSQPDVHVLSIQPDVTMTLVRHCATGHLFHEGPLHALAPDIRAWLRATCEPARRLTPEEMRDNVVALAARIRLRSQAPILVYNMSAVMPGESVDHYRGLGETLTTRIKRLNLALIEASALTGVTIVDVDRIAACAGADRVKLDGLRMNRAGHRLVADDVLRILEAHGCFANS